MDTKRTKYAAEWFYSTVFRDEAILPRQQEPRERVPAEISAARSLENGMPTAWQSREAVFIKQGKLLANFEDDYPYDRPVLRYFPTYQALTDQELRGYFSWRTKLRRGDVQKTSLSFAFLYIYELLNRIGTADPMDGWQKLTDFRDSYGALDRGILPYLDQWLMDYAVYYELDAQLLKDTRKVLFDKSLWVLEDIQNQDTEAIMGAVSVLAPQWLERSKFYREHREDMDTVIARVLRHVSAHCEKRCKKTMVEQYFGPYTVYPVRLFESAVFYDRMKDRSCAVAVDPVRIYHCQNGLWSVQKYGCPERPSAKLEDLMKTIDCVMRECTGYGHPIRCALDTKWLLQCIREEAQRLSDEKKAAQAKKVTIDYSRLASIRRDAAVTRDKLIVEEEAMEDAFPEEPQPAAVPSELPEIPLDEPEYRLLQCLLYGRDYGWVRSAGLMLSVLIDGINEKLFDEFSDSVLTADEPPELIEDYIDDLKEMIHP